MILIDKRRTVAKRPTYGLRLARDADEIRRAQRLRFEVFNLELNEGLLLNLFSKRKINSELRISPSGCACSNRKELARELRRKVVEL